MANANVDAEKLVFAVDIVNFLMKMHYPHVEIELRIDIADVVNNYREHVPQHFTENLKNILREIDNTQGFIIEREFLIQKTKSEADSSSLEEYSKSYKSCNLDKRLSAGRFLVFCARVSLLACFYFVNGRKDDLSNAVDLIKDSFPKDEDECRFLWNEIDNAAEKYESHIQGNAKSTILGVISEESEASVSSGTEGSSKSDMRDNETPYIFSDKPREIADVISSGSEDSCNSNPATNTESDNSANTQDTSSISSSDSLNTLFTKMGRTSRTKSTNSDKNEIIPDVASSTGCAKYVENKQETSTSTADAASNTEYVKCVESIISIITATTTSGPSQESVEYVECRQNTVTTSAAAMNTETVKYAESDQNMAENLESSVQSSSISTSTIDARPKIEIDCKEKSEKAFMEADTETTSAKSPSKSELKSPLKSCLGKRPSPRKEKVSLSKERKDELEPEIKKPKLSLSPENKN